MSSIDPDELKSQLANLAADPTPDARLVFGDWLQSVGHPWGQLIALDDTIASHDLSEREALLVERDALLDEHGEALVGELAGHSALELSWVNGFIDEAIIRAGGDAAVFQSVLPALFACPAATLLRRLVLDGSPKTMNTHRDWDDSHQNVVSPYTCIGLLADAPPTLNELAFGAPPPTGASAYVSAPDLAAVADVLPDLEVLEVQSTGGDPIAPFSFPKLRTLHARFANAETGDLEAIREADLPSLETLTVWLGGTTYSVLDNIYDPDWDAVDYEDRYPSTYPSSDLEMMDVYDADTSVNAEELTDFCEADWPPTLRHLGVMSTELSPDALEAIVTSPLVEQLETLDLSKGVLRTPTLNVLRRHEDALTHLKTLRLGVVPAHQAEALQSMNNVEVSGGQRRAPDFLFRYVATME